MELIKSNDGLIGWKINGKVLWCNSCDEAYNIGWGHIGRIKMPNEKDSFCEEVDFALSTMTRQGHSLAHFGIFGNFMYSETE